MSVIQQIKAARALLEWSQTDLGEYSGLSQTAITNLESGRYRPTLKTLDAIKAALEKGGVEFIDDGVRFTSPTIKIIKEPDFEAKMQDFVYECCVNQSIKEIVFFGLNPTLMPEDHYKRTLHHIDRMAKLGVVTRAIVSDQRKSDELPGPVGSYRAIPDTYMCDASPYFVFGAYVCSILYDARQTLIVRNENLALAHRKTFDFLWYHGKEVV